MPDLKIDFIVFSVGELDVFYYSCQEHFDELLEILRKDEYDEEDVVVVLTDRYEEIVRHMKVTGELSNELKGMMFTG